MLYVGSYTPFIWRTLGIWEAQCQKVGTKIKYVFLVITPLHQEVDLNPPPNLRGWAKCIELYSETRREIGKNSNLIMNNLVTTPSPSGKN